MKIDKALFAEIFGWYGTAAILLAYGLVSLSSCDGNSTIKICVTADSFLYQFLNITGSIGLLSIALVKKVYQSVTINIIWALIGIIALVKLFI